MRSQSFSMALMILLGTSLVACGDDTDGGTKGTVHGVVTNSDPQAIEGATVTIGTASATTDINGTFTIADVPAGRASMTIVVSWYADRTESVTVMADQTIEVTVTMNQAPLQVLAADQTLAVTHNGSFDWTSDLTSVAVVSAPTRAQLDKALYYQNPALYADPSGESAIVPSSPPSVSTTSTFDFPIPAAGTNAGMQAIDQGTIVDVIGDTPVTSAEIVDSAIWEAAVDGYLLDWDLTATTKLFFVGLAVEGQRWAAGGGGIAPQSIVHVYSHAAELWVEVVFQPFVTVDASITDSDGDGLKEVFGRVAWVHVPTPVLVELTTIYMGTTHDTKSLKEILENDMDELYSRSNPSIIGTIGVPYEVAGTGTFAYPFAVVGHGDPSSPSYVVNVLLVNP